MPTQSVNKTDTHKHAALISSAKVQGSHVYRLDGQKVGRIEHMMIDKISGRIAYAVMSAGAAPGKIANNAVGPGQNFYPLPWSLLSYNERLGGYEFDVSDDYLNDAPKFTASDSWDWIDPKRGRRIHDYWRALPYWGF